MPPFSLKAHANVAPYSVNLSCSLHIAFVQINQRFKSSVIKRLSKQHFQNSPIDQHILGVPGRAFCEN
jgi:hypothetical protein